MTYDIALHDDPPALLASWNEGFRFATNGADYLRDIHARWDAITSPVFYIIDMTRLDGVTIEGLVNFANAGTHGPTASLTHPMNRGTIFVTRAAIVRAGARGMKNDAFGSVNILIFNTLDEALAHLRSIIRTEHALTG